MQSLSNLVDSETFRTSEQCGLILSFSMITLAPNPAPNAFLSQLMSSHSTQSDDPHSHLLKGHTQKPKSKDTRMNET